MEKYREKLDFGNNPVSSLFFLKRMEKDMQEQQVSRYTWQTTENLMQNEVSKKYSVQATRGDCSVAVVLGLFIKDHPS